MLRSIDAIQGLCLSMCPQEEMDMRVKESIVHSLEVGAAGRRLVKSYSRSAADSNMAVPRLLRPFPVLRETVEYLVLEVTLRTDVPLAVVYDFVSDRLRAVRQDMTIQRLPQEQCQVLLEPMVRFYVYFGYRLCEHPIRVYDPVLNKQYLLECLKLILSCYDGSYDKEIKLAAFLSDLEDDQSLYTEVTNEELEKVADALSNLELEDEHQTSKTSQTKLTCDRVLMESLYILCNLGDTSPMMRYHQLPKKLRSDPTLELAFQVALANMTGNFVRAVKLSAQMCPLTFCAFSTYLPVIQKRALLVLSHAYNSRQLLVPCQVVRNWLSYSSDAEVIEAVKHYGLKVTGDGIHFCKADFNKEAVLLPKKNLQKKMDLSIQQHVFTYDTASV